LKSFAHIPTGQFDYKLPEDRIAPFPLENRHDSRLLIRKADGSISSDIFRNLALYLEDGCHMVINNSKVIPARLIYRKKTGAIIEILCLSPANPADYTVSLTSQYKCTWNCLVGNLRKFGCQSLSMTISSDQGDVSVAVRRLNQSVNPALIEFTWNPGSLSFAEVLSIVGKTPLPPYIRREPAEVDRLRYQTIYSKHEGSVAAPTAGLHFTDHVLTSLSKKQISMHEVTLHVGAGTFRPVQGVSIDDHEMHSEFFTVTGDLIKRLARLDRSLIVVGTTTVRTLETIYWLGVKLIHANAGDTARLHLKQWEAYNLPQDIPMQRSMDALLKWLSDAKKNEITASTQLMIVPGYAFRMVKVLLTNFHQPKSTLLMLVAALIGDSWKEVYNYALANDFRFLSYGDSSLLFT
jgi:S-adenosylmethionine:tRNA ribosyltransferase-isomerase